MNQERTNYPLLILRPYLPASQMIILLVETLLLQLWASISWNTVLKYNLNSSMWLVNGPSMGYSNQCGLRFCLIQASTEYARLRKRPSLSRSNSG